MATLKNTTINDTGFIDLPSGTTAQRPTSPSAGEMRYNTEYNVVEYYNGTSWIAEDGLVRATGTGYTDESRGNHTIFTYLGSGNINIIHGGTVEVLVVAGGGAGGYYVGGGGGAGGYIEQALEVNSGTYQVLVGPGGAGTPNRPAAAVNNGTDSSVFGLTAIGGGGGGSYNGYRGNPGGSAGGQGGPHTGDTQQRQLAEPGQGNDGGVFINLRSGTPTTGSGGGGAGYPGDDAVNGGSTTPAHGGAGRRSWVCPFGYWYAGGGGGGNYNSSTAGSGGDGGIGGGGGGGHSSNNINSLNGFGGPGGFSRSPGGNGTTADPGDGGAGGANTGGGGGGAGHYSNGDNATGGSGIVIVRWYNERIRNG